MAIYNPNDLLYFDVLEGRPIWACAYKIDNQTGRSILRQVPVQGEIRGDRFYVYKKDGTLRRTGDVWAGYRWYADTFKGRTSGIKANFLYDVPAYAIGYPAKGEDATEKLLPTSTWWKRPSGWPIRRNSLQPGSSRKLGTGYRTTAL